MLLACLGKSEGDWQLESAPTSIVGIIQQYLRRDVSLADLREWLAVYQWDLPRYAKTLAAILDVEVAYLDDGYINENSLRCRLTSLLEIRQKSAEAELSNLLVPFYPGDQDDDAIDDSLNIYDP